MLTVEGRRRRSKVWAASGWRDGDHEDQPARIRPQVEFDGRSGARRQRRSLDHDRSRADPTGPASGHAVASGCEPLPAGRRYTPEEKIVRSSAFAVPFDAITLASAAACRRGFGALLPRRCSVRESRTGTMPCLAASTTSVTPNSSVSWTSEEMVPVPRRHVGEHVDVQRILAQLTNRTRTESRCTEGGSRAAAGCRRPLPVIPRAWRRSGCRRGDETSTCHAPTTSPGSCWRSGRWEC